MQIEFDRLQKIISESSYESTGAITEKNYYGYIQTNFPNSELFWRSFIVPLTNRINDIRENIPFHANREGVSEQLADIGSIHYSIFLQLIYAHKIYEKQHFSFFEDFYAHLGTICDLVEEFLIKLYLLILECNNSEQSKILQKLTKEEFLEIAAKWYDKEYSNLYELYFKKGKQIPIKIPTKKHILNEYYGELDSWKRYKTFSELIKPYRNVIVHHHKLAFLQDSEGNQYVPKKEKITNYKSWKNVGQAANDSSKLDDFILQSTLMYEDLKEMEITLNDLWEKPIQDMHNLLFVTQNKNLLTKYNLAFTP